VGSFQQTRLDEMDKFVHKSKFNSQIQSGHRGSQIKLSIKKKLLP